MCSCEKETNMDGEDNEDEIKKKSEKILKKNELDF